MTKIRASLILLGLGLGVGLNVIAVPQIMTPRPPAFNGADIAENWEWRSMAFQSHSWWLWEQFPDAQAIHVGYVPPIGNPGALEVGMQLEQWTDEFFSTELDTSLPPLDVSELDVRDELYSYQQVYGRIHCRSGQEMERRDTCYYFVAWSPDLLPNESPRFIGVLTNRDPDNEEMALIEENLLRSISPIPIGNILTIDESRDL